MLGGPQEYHCADCIAAGGEISRGSYRCKN
uniref:Uncharacterized protein n=1 Tax=Anguilla anguilla TaxID=7936 RepID=A0A0E9TSX0_ANGAN